MSSVDSLQSLSKRDGTIWCVEVEDVDAISSQLSQTLVERGEDAFCLVHTGLVRVALGSKGQTTVFPVGVLGPRLLFASNIRASRVNLIVALRLQVVQSFVVVGKISLTST